MIRHEVIGLVYTRKCPLACRHCITESSPSASGKMRLEQAKAYLPVLARFTHSISFTGGEPLLFHKEIVELTTVARTLGLGVRVVTGAGWVRDERTTRRKVSELARAGVTGMTISSDGYHEAFVARDRPLLLARLAAAAGFDVRINSVVTANASSAAPSGSASLGVTWQPIHLVRLGTARTLPAEQFHRTDGPPRGPCGAVLKAQIDCDGTVYACCGPSLYSTHPSPLILGNAEAEPLGDILDRATRDPILEVISLVGPFGLYHLLHGHPSSRDLYGARAEYTSLCELCLEITNVPALVAKVRERLHDHDAQALVAAARMWHLHHKSAAVA